MRSLSLSLLCLALLAAAASAQGGRYAREISTWVAQSGLKPPPADAVLFVGSSSIRRWEHMARDFADYEVIQRGFGGSQFADLNGYVDDIVVPYDPAAIVVFEGTNDVATGKSAATVLQDYLTFVSLVHGTQNQARPPIPILFLGITPTPSRWSLWSVASAVNAQIQSHAQGDPALHYVDIPAAFLATGSPPSTALFAPDLLHLNAAGYALWSSVIRPAVEAVLPPNKIYVANPRHPTAGARLLFDFGPGDTVNGRPAPSPDANGNHWNSWHAVAGGIGILAGESLGDLLTTAGARTGIDLWITGGFVSNGRQNGGLLAPQAALLGPLAIVEATEDFFFGDDLDAPAGLVLTGLSGSTVYDLHLFGSRNTTETRITRHTLETGRGSIAVDLQTSGLNLGVTANYHGNESAVAQLEGLVADRFGQLFVDLSRVAGAFDYLNAMQLVVRAPGVSVLGVGCGSASPAPVLAAAVPQLGQPWPLGARGFGAGVPAAVYLSAAPVTPVVVGGCSLHVALAQPSNLALWAVGSTGPAGGWTSSNVVPSIPALYGLQMSCQAFALDAAAPLGFAATHGVLAPVTQ